MALFHRIHWALGYIANVHRQATEWNAGPIVLSKHWSKRQPGPYVVTLDRMQASLARPDSEED
jgi:hypothetical protein